MKYLKSILCLLLILTLVGCGNGAGDGSENQNDHGDDGTKGTVSGEPAPVPQDMWFNAEGQYGSVEYTYDEKDQLSKTVFYYHSGKVWRTIEYDIVFDYDGAPPNVCQMVYNANGSRLFQLSYSVQDREFSEGQIPNYWTGYDYFLEDRSSEVDYSSFGGADSYGYFNNFNGAQDYYIVTWKAADVIEKITHFHRDGTQYGTYFMYYEDGKLAYVGTCDHYYTAPYEFYKAEYDDAGRVIRLAFGSGDLDAMNGKVEGFKAGSKGVEIILTYDNAGHLIGIDDKGKNFRSLWDFEYEGDRLVATQYRNGRHSYDLENFSRGYYTFHNDGTFATADYGFLSGGLGSGDTSYYVFSYYENGMIAGIQGYWESPYNAGSDDLDLEWEYFFAEEGYKSMHRVFTTDYYFNPIYHEYTYDAVGNKVSTVSGKIGEDGTLIPN